MTYLQLMPKSEILLIYYIDELGISILNAMVQSYREVMSSKVMTTFFWG